MPRRRTRNVRGQVLLVAVVVLLILLVVVFFLFDLHNVIRTRTRTQTAADAAALAGAAWQGRTLNMIGELNLLKAATVMLTSMPGTPSGDPVQDLQTATAMLTQMQARLAYVGPLVGVAAAQQAAKHNGMYSVDSYSRIVSDHVRTYLDPPGDSIYWYFYGDDPLNTGFPWLAPYGAMLSDIAGEGIAANPVSNRFLCGTPELQGPGADLLLDPAFYRAIYNRHYCWFYARGIGPNHPPIDIRGMQFLQQPEGFFPGSELLCLYIGFATGAPQEDEIAAFLAARGLAPLPADQPGLPEVRWAVYDRSADGYGWDQTDLYNAVNPYLRSDFRPEYSYSGACARFLTTAQPDLLTGRWSWKYGQSATEERPTVLAPALAWSGTDFGGGQSFAREAARLAAAEARLAALRAGNVVESVAAAKPFGSVNGRAPQTTDVVLPVFSEVRLIPCVVARSHPLSAEADFYRFLIDYFGNPAYPDVPADVAARYAYYLNAITMYNDRTSDFSQAWFAYDDWRNAYMAGPDGRPDTADDQPDPCLPRGGPGGPGGGGSIGGPGIIH